MGAREGEGRAFRLELARNPCTNYAGGARDPIPCNYHSRQTNTTVGRSMQSRERCDLLREAINNVEHF